MTIGRSTSIGAGSSKAAAINRIAGVLVVLALATACAQPERDVESAPIVISQPESSRVHMDLVIANAGAEVEAALPGAKLTFFSIVADCRELNELRGKVNLRFTQTRRALFGERVSVARVIVDTTQATLQMTIRDETEFYPATEPLELSGLAVSDIARALEAHMVSLNTCGTTLVLARSDTDGPWGVRCGPPDTVFIECLEIDPTTGAITEQR
jgi:hypothetical protein